MKKEEFKDLFSENSGAYLKFRPLYPETVFKYLASLCSEHELAWDCACGTGQATTHLASLFTNVIATDASARQIVHAPVISNVEYRIEKAEEPTLGNSSANLVVIAQALHWLDHERFYPQLSRIVKPNGFIAAIVYGLPSIHPQIDAVIRHFHHITLKSYWEPERQHVVDLYQNLHLPYSMLDKTEFSMNMGMDMDQLLGYISTWSALSKCKLEQQLDPMTDFAHRLKKVWPTFEEKLNVNWTLACKVGRNRK